MIELRVLGPPRIDAPNGRAVEAVVRQPRRVALLTYLAAAIPRGAHRRDKLVAMFWPESDEMHARAALNQALYVLRSRLGDDVFVSQRSDEVAVAPGAIWCDAAAFEDALDAGHIGDALALYRGDLLDGFHIADAPEFERWVEGERQRLRQRASEGAWMLAEAHAADGRVLEAQRWARRAADLMSADETVVRRLMLFFRDVGDRAAAIRAYEAFVYRLAQEYELEPSPETHALASAIRQEERTVSPPALTEVAPIPVDHRVARLLPRSWTTPAILAAAAIGTAGFVGLWSSTRQPVRGPGSQWVQLIDVDEVPPLAEGVGGRTIAVSHHGNIVYIGDDGAGPQLYLKHRNRTRFTAIPQTLGALQPFFSPDGEWIGYIAGNAIRRVRISGGPSVEVCPVAADVEGPSWGDGDMIVFATSAGIFQVSASGGRPELVAASDSTRPAWYRWPDVLPGSRTALLTIVNDSGSQLAAVSLGSGDVRPLGVPGTSPRYVAPGYLVWARQDGALLAARFDATAVRIIGPVMSVAEDVHVGMSGAAKVAVSPEALVYVPRRAGNTLVLVDTMGNADVVRASAWGFEAPRFSPDGRHILAAQHVPDTRLADLWMIDLAGKESRRITVDSGNNSPVMSSTLPQRLAFASRPDSRQNGFEIRLMWTDSGAPARTLRRAEVGQLPREFTRDGRALVYDVLDLDTERDIWIVPLDGVAAPRPYLHGPANERAAALSPNGRRMAWVSDRSGRDEVYVGEFPELRQPVQVSHAGGREPRWAPNGRALFYRSDDGMAAVELVSDSPIVLASRRVLFDDSPYATYSNGAAYDVHPDGDRFVMLRRDGHRGDLLLRLEWLEWLAHRPTAR